MTRSFRFVVPGLATALVSTARVASAQTPPPVVQGAGIPAAAPPPPAGPAAPAGQAAAIQGVQAIYVDKPAFDVDGRTQGWIGRSSVAATFSFANNSNVVGQTDGSSISFGFKFDGTLDYNHEKHEWRNALGMLGAITRTPVIDDFVKTSDNLQFDSTYLFHAVKVFGPYARVSYQSSMFRGTDVRATNYHYFVQPVNQAQLPGGLVPRTPGQPLPPGAMASTPCPTGGGMPSAPCEVTADRFELSDPFKPSTFKQSIGVFVQPYASDPFTLELRGGAGAEEVLANGQYAIQPSPTPVPGTYYDPFRIDVKALSDVNQLGAELAASIWGSFVGKKVTYKFNFDAMTPFAHTALVPGDTRSVWDLTNIQVDGAISFHLVDWASVDYNLRAIRQPQVVDVFQIQNTLLLTFGQTWSNAPKAATVAVVAPVCPPPAPAPPPPPPPPPRPAIPAQ